jgi:hypothetical protein
LKATQLLRFSGAAYRDPDIEAWMNQQPIALGSVAREWFEVMRHCGEEVHELVHDGFPTACVADAGFAYVAAFKGHVNIGFFRGAEIADPERMLEGVGRFMRHVKLVPGRTVNTSALKKLVEAAYIDMKERVQAEEDVPLEDRRPAGKRSPQHFR